MQRCLGILIGGSSHVGKSTLSKQLAAALGIELISTDDLARHPGRSCLSRVHRWRNIMSDCRMKRCTGF